MKQVLGGILASGKLTLGEYTKEFERQFAQLVGVKRAIAVNSGTSALEISLRASGLRPGDEVIIPTNTFVATGAAVVFAGGKPVLTDVSKKAMSLSLDATRRAISRKTKGVIAVHIGGLICPEIQDIKELCVRRGLFLIEDAAHAQGSRIDGRPAGSLGSAGCFSFYPTKVITTGEGGMITTDNQELADLAEVLRDQGKESFNSSKVIRLGYNWRMPELCAALGITQLRRLSEFIEKRNRVAAAYDTGFGEVGLDRILTPKNQLNNYYKYTFFLPNNVDRDEFKAACRDRGVLYGGEIYWPPLHLQPAFVQFVVPRSRFRVADKWGPRMVNPPIFTQMTESQIERVISVTKEVFEKFKD